MKTFFTDDMEEQFIPVKCISCNREIHDTEKVSTVNMFDDEVRYLCQRCSGVSELNKPIKERFGGKNVLRGV
jgi:predicted RNA-binding Zn-ribbon protein involved in translation (DUF1610 family)